MKPLAPHTGWLWIRQGFQYFRQHPLEFSTLFLAYLFFILMLGLVSLVASAVLPHVGQFLGFVFLPLFTLSFMQACRQIDEGARVHPHLILYGFRSPKMATLMLLGLLYFFAACLALWASTAVDGGAFLQFISGQEELNPAVLEQSNMAGAMLIAMLVYAPALMALWFAGPLIAWQDMPLLKAVFYSFFASVKSVRAFVIYVLAWFAVAGIIPAILLVLVAAITGSQEIIVLMMLPVSMISTIILYCSFYPSYKSIFSQAGAEATESSTIS